MEIQNAPEHYQETPPTTNTVSMVTEMGWRPEQTPRVGIGTRAMPGKIAAVPPTEMEKSQSTTTTTSTSTMMMMMMMMTTTTTTTVVVMMMMMMMMMTTTTMNEQLKK